MIKHRREQIQSREAELDRLRGQMTTSLDAASGTGVQHSVYKGSYIVGQINGMWKILSGNLNKVA